MWISGVVIVKQYTQHRQHAFLLIMRTVIVLWFEETKDIVYWLIANSMLSALLLWSVGFSFLKVCCTDSAICTTALSWGGAFLFFLSENLISKSGAIQSFYPSAPEWTFIIAMKRKGAHRCTQIQYRLYIFSHLLVTTHIERWSSCSVWGHLYKKRKEKVTGKDHGFAIGPELCCAFTWEWFFLNSFCQF